MPAVRKSATSTVQRTGAFTGLNNVSDPIDLGLSAQVQADNVYVTRNRSLRRVPGWTRRADLGGASAYATRDFRRLYAIRGGCVYRVNDDWSSTPLGNIPSDGQFYFTEVNGDVYFTDGVAYGCIERGRFKTWGVPVPPGFDVTVTGGGNLRAGTYQFVATFVADDGRESGNSQVTSVDVDDGARIDFTAPTLAGYTTSVYAATPADPTFYLVTDDAGSVTFTDIAQAYGDELPFWNLNAPRGVHPAYFEGRIYTAEYFPERDLSVVWRSLPLQYHHFDPGAEGIAIPGQVLQLCATRQSAPSERNPDALMIGTDREIYAFNESLVKVADYGVTAGRSFTEHRGQVYMWTTRGAARAMPFENLMEKRLSVAPGTFSSGVVIEQDGTRRYVVSIHKGGEAFNPRR